MKMSKKQVPMRIFRFNDRYGPKNVTLPDREQMAKDFGVDINEINKYFEHYRINRRYPIRSLDKFDFEFLELYNQWLENNRNARTRTSMEEFLMAMESHMGHYDHEFLKERLELYVKYEDFILTPYLMYGNSESPLHEALTVYEIQLMATRIAYGEHSTKHEKFVPANVRIRALELLGKLKEGTDGKYTDQIEGEVKGIDPTKMSTHDLLSIVGAFDGPEPVRAWGKPNKQDAPDITDIIDVEVDQVTKKPGRPAGSKSKYTKDDMTNGEPTGPKPGSKNKKGPGRPKGTTDLDRSR